jgi:Fe-S-cluster containining protein
MADNHDSILRDWRENAARKEDANFRFLRSLKMVDDPDRIDALARELHEDAFARIDCTRCANCCKTMPPGFTAEDVSRIAAHLGLTPEALIAAHLEADPADRGLRTRVTPCPFLGADDRCTIYAVRPQDCREFPHTDKEGFSWRTYQHAANTLTCPAVYRIVQGMRRRRRRHQA